MPIYEYRCDSCAYLFDVLQKVGDPPLKECPDCGKLELRRLVSAPSFRLKGGGWYETDFKSEKERKRNLAEGRDTPGDSDAKADKAATGEKSDQAKASDKPQPSDKTQPSDKEPKSEKKARPAERKKKPGGTDAVA